MSSSGPSLDIPWEMASTLEYFGRMGLGKDEQEEESRFVTMLWMS